MGIGAIYHTVNPRLFADQIVWIMNHAEDRFVMTDLTFVPLLEKLADKLPTVERYIILTDAEHMPAAVDRQFAGPDRLAIRYPDNLLDHVLHFPDVTGQR